MTGRVGVFGGTFDPIHVGHLAAVEDAAAELELQKVLFVPNRNPPHKDLARVTPASDRVAMVQRAIKGNDLFALSLVEQERQGPSRMLDTMRTLHAELGPEVDLHFLLGCDALAELHTWYEPRALLDEFHVAVMDRPTGRDVQWSEVERYFPDIRRKVAVVHVAQLEISGEDIRRRVRSGMPIRYHVLPAVADYILDHGLYL